MNRIIALTAMTILAGWIPAQAGETPAPPEAKVYFIGLVDGDKVTSPLLIRFGMSGMGVAPAGVEKPATGHHHLLINRPPFGEGEDGDEEFEFSIPADENHMHFGGGQTEAVLQLPPGSHTLQLVAGDQNHIPHEPPVLSQHITITVE